MTFMEMEDLIENLVRSQEESYESNTFKRTTMAQTIQHAKSNSIQNKLGKAYQTKLNRDKSGKSFLFKILKNIQIHNQMKMCIGTIVKLLESQIVI